MFITNISNWSRKIGYTKDAATTAFTVFIHQLSGTSRFGNYSSSLYFWSSIFSHFSFSGSKRAPSIPTFMHIEIRPLVELESRVESTIAVPYTSSPEQSPKRTSFDLLGSNTTRGRPTHPDRNLITRSHILIRLLPPI